MRKWILQTLTATYLMWVITLTTEGYEEVDTANSYSNIPDVGDYLNY
jgi:diketogulonate reductase-like aldo/keto reductase